MRITVIGGTGLIGTRLVRALDESGHDVVTASRATGVNSFTGEGLADALAGADVVVDVSNSSYTDEEGAREFFYASTMNILGYGEAAGVGNHVVLSVVGTDRLARAEGGYFVAKEQQERLVTASGRPFTLSEIAALDLRARQDDREVVPDPLGTYFGAHLAPRDLLPEPTATIAPTRYHDWRVRATTV